MRYQLKLFYPLLLPTFKVLAILLVLILALWLVRRGRFANLIFSNLPTRTLRLWVITFSSHFALFLNYLYDADPFMAKFCWLSLSILVVFRVLVKKHFNKIFFITLVFLWLTFISTDMIWIQIISTLLWGSILFFSQLKAFGKQPLIYQVCVGCLVFPIFTFFLPIVVPTLINFGHLSPLMVKLEEKGNIYGYCEFPEKKRLYGSVPYCSVSQIEECIQGYIVEYNTEPFKRIQSHEVFNNNFVGVLRETFCFKDRIYVTMNSVKLRNHLRHSNVMSFNILDAKKHKETIFSSDELIKAGPDLHGHRYAYIEEKNSLLLVSEWSNRVGLFDLGSQKYREIKVSRLPRKNYDGTRSNGLITGSWSVNKKRNSVVLHEFMDGSRIYEVDVDNWRVIKIYDTFDTGGLAVAVDEKYDRLIVSGLWGINVIDSKTGNTVFRKRLAPGVRAAVIDKFNNLIYLNSTIGALLTVLDRKSLRTVKQFTVGSVGRRMYLTLDGQSLFLSNLNGSYKVDVQKFMGFFQDHLLSSEKSHGVKEAIAPLHAKGL